MPNAQPPSGRPLATPVDRRTFVKAASAAGLGLAVAPSGLAAQAPAPGRRRYAIVGLGSRHAMYRSAILGTHAPHAELVGLCDINPGRVALSQQAAAARGVTVPGYAAADFEKMIRETKPHVRHRHHGRRHARRLHRPRAGGRAATSSPRSR